MTEQQWAQVKEQLPQGAQILRAYTAAENGQLRVISKAPGDAGEPRYIVYADEQGNIKIKRF